MKKIIGLHNNFFEKIKKKIVIQGVPKKEDESITPLFIGRF
jgi:hypothetical protein